MCYTNKPVLTFLPRSLNYLGIEQEHQFTVDSMYTLGYVQEILGTNKKRFQDTSEQGGWVMSSGGRGLGMGHAIMEGVSVIWPRRALGFPQKS